VSARFVVAALVATLVVGCGSGRPSVIAPFTKEDGTEAGGWPVMASGPDGLTLRFVAKATLGVGIVLTNTAARPVTLVDVRALGSARSLVRQTGTQLLAWSPPTCNGRHSCPALGFLHPPYAAVRPQALEVAPRNEAAVQLDFRMASCDAVPFATPGAAQQIQVDYRVGHGGLQQQLLSLGSSRLNLRMPSRRDCLPRPRSTISVEGPYATGSGWTIPVSSGDTCSRTRGGALLFASRLYQSPNNAAVRVEIRLPRFRGAGLYRTFAKPAPALGPAHVATVVGIGSHGWKAFHSTSAVVSVRAIGPKAIKGRFRARIAGYGHSSFRTFGAWRCALA
jgi:hypothetical protein